MSCAGPRRVNSTRGKAAPGPARRGPSSTVHVPGGAEGLGPFRDRPVKTRSTDLSRPATAPLGPWSGPRAPVKRLVEDASLPRPSSGATPRGRVA